MTDELTSTGLNLDDFETVRALVVAQLRATISNILDVSPDQPIGQITDITLEHRQQISELLQEIYSAMDPEQATGQSLDALCSMTGTYRNPATYGTVGLTLNLNAATTVPAGSIAAVTGDPDNQWILDADVTSVGAGNYAGTATASETGVIQALAGTITTIVTPVAGWNSVTNALDADEGEEVESDTDLRLRREVELQQGGSTTLGAVVAAVSAIEEVLQVIGYENVRSYVQDGMPPKSIEIVYWSGATSPTPPAVVAEIAETIQSEKAGGIQAYGTNTDDGAPPAETQPVTDDYGTYNIGFTRAEDLRVRLDYTLTTNSDYPGHAAFQAYVSGWCDDNLGIGDDVLYTKMIDVGYNVAGIDNLSLQLEFFGAGYGTADLSVGARQIATVAAGDVIVP
jgi:uncharacterized phage protein gp47/JayE